MPPRRTEQTNPIPCDADLPSPLGAGFVLIVITGRSDRLFGFILGNALPDIYTMCMNFSYDVASASVCPASTIMSGR
jgi:hypothetical protein